jgi:hypothetical protein
VFVVNDDGTIAIFNSRKESNVQAWTQWTTFDGSVAATGGFKAVGVVLEDIYFVVRRTLNSTVYGFLEQYDRDLYTDCAIQRVAASTAAITGLDHLNAEECRVRADNFVLGNETPAAGSITIDQVGLDVEVGLEFNPEITPMPLNTMVPVGGAGPNFLQKRRVVKIMAKVRDTLGLLVNGRPIGDRQYDVDNFDEAAAPKTQNITIEETSNWDRKEDKLVTFSQIDPLPLELLAIEVQMESEP